MGAQAKSRKRLADLRGCTEPRIWTKPLRELTPETTHGFAAIEFAEKVLKMDLYSWQKWVLIHALEVLSDEMCAEQGVRAGSFRFRTVIVLVARQNGKTALAKVVIAYFLFCLQASYVLGTAQDVSRAKATWDEVVKMIRGNALLSDALPPEGGRSLDGYVRTVNGEIGFSLIGYPGRYEVKSGNADAARGGSADLAFVDEIVTYRDWAGFNAISASQNARPSAQMWAVSNAGDRTSLVLRQLRLMAHDALGDPDGIVVAEDPMTLKGRLEDASDGVEEDEDEGPDLDDDTVGVFEYSAAPGRTISDTDGWCEANPSLGEVLPSVGYALVTARTIRGEMRKMTEWGFRAECLCQWADGSLDGVFPPGSWEAGHTEDRFTPRVACVDLSWDRGETSIAVAADIDVVDDSGAVVRTFPWCDLAARRPGTDWVIPWLQALVDAQQIDAIAYQPGSPAGAFEDMDGWSDLPTVKWQGPDLGKSWGRFYDLVRPDPEAVQRAKETRDTSVDGWDADVRCGTLRHPKQPAVEVAAIAARTRVLSGGVTVLDRRNPIDIAPLNALVGAVWALGVEPVDVGDRFEDPDEILYFL